MNKILKGLLLSLIVLFLSLYLGRYLNTYNQNNSTLTDEAIMRFEEDLKNNKEIIPSNYLPKEKNYDNKISRLGIKTSNVIENSFKNVLRYFLRYLEDY